MCPIFDFKCGDCDKVEERITHSDVAAITCVCGGMMAKQLSAPPVRLDGTNPDFPGAYDKWARDREKRFRDNRRKNG